MTKTDFRLAKALLVGVLILSSGATATVGAQTGEAQLAVKFKAATEAQRAGRFDEAAAAYAEVIRLHPEVAEVYVNYGLVRYEQKRFDDAIKLFEKAIQLKPSLAGAQLFLGISYYSTNRLEDALKALNAAVEVAPNDAKALMWRGLTLMAMNNSDLAAKSFDMAAALVPDDVDILFHRGRAHLKVSQDSYRQMFKANPKSARVHLVLGQSYAEAGRDAEAAAEYELVIKLAPLMPGVHEALGSLYWKNSQLDEAESAFEQELKIDSYNTIAMYKLGSIRVERGKPGEGIKLLEASVAQNPENFDAYYYLGKAQSALNQNEAAIVNFKKLIDNDPSSELAESAYYQLSRVYRKTGRAAEAQATLTTFQKIRDEREQKSNDKLKKKQEAAQNP